jgi:putative oxidoreductase
MSRSRDLALLLLRCCGLGLALAHGLGKVTALAGGRGAGLVNAVGDLGFPAPLLFAWAAALVELGGGLLVAVGLATRVGAGLAAVVMAVAAFVRHRALAGLAVAAGLSTVPPETVASWGSPEKALLFLAVFLSLALMGPGRYSLDRLIARRRSGARPRG